MRHHSNINSFGRKKSVREALMASLAGALIRYESIETTEAKAKALRPYIEKLVTKAKNEKYYTVRTKTASQDQTNKLMKDIAPRYKDRAGGYTRITKMGRRRGTDAAKLARIEFV